ncbi:helix-turn-helix transcriptional regulator [Modestobacter sp. VKM Ac-2986]|uniref:helix-turn-helix transcriptional regulator n=1 Tax=Modestobacter sp. VKM Ac-2986 TaxID=3004140 RepID=UPI0022AB7B97|nr:helix-turn-helix transcriptional regulator [Modestobacter sp. VKM Ac-2986]MCZ2830837.1 helix-turn-helix transcriptional regulator [Modestobacter sp. VKM Ac-2986]
MDNRAEIRDFLASRRAKLDPAQVGLPSSGRRRVPGLRREEVAVLAGVSTDWYIRLERGHIAEVSDDVLDAVARALRLDEAERAHLLDLARAARPSRIAPRRRAARTVRSSVQWMLDAMTGAPAIVRNGRMDIVAANDLGRALYSPVYESPVAGAAQKQHANIARFQFLDPAARDFHLEWAAAADTTVAIMRTEAGRDPHNRALTDLVGELVTRSEEFRRRWAGHDVRLHHTGVKTFTHPVTGSMDLTFEAMDLPSSDTWGLNLTVYAAEPGSPVADQLALLASWWATTHTETVGDEGRAPADR